MAQERRQHRTPFTADLSWLNDRNGDHVAYCINPQVAHYIQTCCNNFDALCEALDLCRGEIDLEEVARISPAIKRIRELRERVEKELRGNHN